MVKYSYSLHRNVQDLRDDIKLIVKVIDIFEG